MIGALLFFLIGSPCSQAAPIDAGELAPCSGVIVTTQQARDFVKSREELAVRRAFKCPACPPCPTCPPPPPAPSVVSWALGGVVAGAILSAALGIALAN
jgi:hypothetical protein